MVFSLQPVNFANNHFNDLSKANLDYIIPPLQESQNIRFWPSIPIVIPTHCASFICVPHVPVN